MVTIAPADPADQPRSVISHTRVNVHTSDCGTTSSTDTAWMRHSVDVPRYGLARSSAVRLGARRPRRIEHADGGDDGGHGAHDGREQQRRRYPVCLGDAAESPTRPSRLPAAWRSAGCPSPARAARAGTSRPPARPLAELLLAAAIPPRNRKAPTATSECTDAAAKAAAAVSAEPSREHDPFADPIDQVAPRDQGDDHAEARHRRHQAGPREIEAPLGVQSGDQEGDAVDEDVGAQRGRRARSPASTSGARCRSRGGHAAMVTRCLTMMKVGPNI